MSALFKDKVFFDVDWAIGDNADGLFVRKDQYIPDDFLTRNRNLRADSISNRAGEFHHFASIPTVVVEKWLAEGFDVYKEPLKAIVKKLKQENLDAFLTSNKSL